MVARSSAAAMALAAMSLVFACTSSSEGDPAPSENPNPNPNVDASAGDASDDGCKESEVTIEANGEHIEVRPGASQTELNRVVGVYPSRDGLAVLAYRIAADRSARIAILGPGPKSVELASIPDVLAANGGEREVVASAITTPDGKRCAVFAKTASNVMLGCEGEPPEDSGIALDYKSPMSAVVDPSGRIDVYVQKTASFALVQRAAGGGWKDVEQFESSVSWPEDAVLDASGQVVCFISMDDRAVLKVGSGTISSVGAAARCRVGLAGSTIHVVTDKGYAAVPASGAGERGATFTMNPVVGQPTKAELLWLMMADSVPFAVYRDTEVAAFRAVSLTSGAVRELGTAIGVTTHVDRATHSFYLASQTYESASQNGPVPQKIHVKALCTSHWK